MSKQSYNEMVNEQWELFVSLAAKSGLVISPYLNGPSNIQPVNEELPDSLKLRNLSTMFGCNLIPNRSIDFIHHDNYSHNSCHDESYEEPNYILEQEPSIESGTEVIQVQLKEQIKEQTNESKAAEVVKVEETPNESKAAEVVQVQLKEQTNESKAAEVVKVEETTNESKAAEVVQVQLKEQTNESNAAEVVPVVIQTNKSNAAEVVQLKEQTNKSNAAEVVKVQLKEQTKEFTYKPLESIEQIKNYKTFSNDIKYVIRYFGIKELKYIAENSYIYIFYNSFWRENNTKFTWDCDKGTIKLSSDTNENLNECLLNLAIKLKEIKEKC